MASRHSRRPSDDHGDEGRVECWQSSAGKVEPDSLPTAAASICTSYAKHNQNINTAAATADEGVGHVRKVALSRKSAGEDVEPEHRATSLPVYNFSFAMGGWLMIYNFGVAKCLLDHGLHKVQPERQRVIGSSAGSLAAAALVLEADIDKIVVQAKTSFVPRAHAAKMLGLVYGMFHIGTFLQESMRACLPFDRVPHKTSPRGRLIVVMSSLLGWNSVRAKEFDNGQELADALRCSCAVFPLVMPHRFRGQRCFDGFFSEGPKSPSLDEEESGGLETVTISPLYASSASIRPSRYVPLSWIALPPNDPGAIDWLYDLGYRDGLFWMAKSGIEHTCSHKGRLSKSARGTTTTDHAQVANNKTEGQPRGENSNDGGLSRDRSGDPVALRPAVTELLSPSTTSGGDRVNRGAGRGTANRARETAAGGTDYASTSNENGPNVAKQEGTSEEASGGARRYVRTSFVLSGCRMRPRRERHPKLDAPIFVPSLEQFVGHGSYHAVADFLFVVFFNVVWRPAAALLLYTDLLARFALAVSCGVAKELRPLLWWLAPTILLVALGTEEGSSLRDWTAASFSIAAIITVRALREGAPSRPEWREAGRCVRGLLEYRILVRCLPWGRREHVRSEALESSLLYRAISFFM